MTRLWSASDDLWLWENRSVPVSSLAAKFDRNDGGIRSRLKHLCDPEHNAFKRLFLQGPTCEDAAMKRTKICSSATSFSAALPTKRIAEGVTSHTKRPPIVGHNIEREVRPDTQQEEDSISFESLNSQQQIVAVEAIEQGNNVFLTGAAGVGKSFLLKYIIQQLQIRFSSSTVAVTASTGVAATHIGGCTIHSFAGIGLGRGNLETVVHKVCSNGAAMARWNSTNVLIIDEISMLDSTILDKIESCARRARASEKVFGGIQLVFCGDFFQLPPVQLGKFGAKFAFEASFWKRANIQVLELNEVVRQAGDVAFIEMLHHIRVGHFPRDISLLLSECHVDVKAPPSDGILPSKLYCKNEAVDKENLSHLLKLPGQLTYLPAFDVWKRRPGDASGEKQLLDSIERAASRNLPLKPGAQVMLTRNMPEHGLVNGSRGVVLSLAQLSVGSDDADEGVHLPVGSHVIPVVKFDNGVELAVHHKNVFKGGADGALVRWQVPLKLAWAITVHKSQVHESRLAALSCNARFLLMTSLSVMSMLMI